MPRGIPNDPAAYRRKIRRWARYANIGRLIMAQVILRNISYNNFYKPQTRHLADECIMRLDTLKNLVAYENKHNEDTETG